MSPRRPQIRRSHSAANSPGRPLLPRALLAAFQLAMFTLVLHFPVPTSAPSSGQLDAKINGEGREGLNWMRRLEERRQSFDDSSVSSSSSASMELESAEIASSRTKQKRSGRSRTGKRRRETTSIVSRKEKNLGEDETDEEEAEMPPPSNRRMLVPSTALKKEATSRRPRQHAAASLMTNNAAGSMEDEEEEEEDEEEDGHAKYRVDVRHPIHILFPLPTDEDKRNENPFAITILKAKPVVDEAVEDVYRRQLVPPGSLSIHFEDSMLSDAHGPNVAINQLVDNKLDCIIGYAFVYALAPVARMSPFWRDKDSNGIPVITSVGLTANLDNRREYQLMTRISSPYKVVKNAILALYSDMEWIKSAYLFHEQRHDAANPSIPYGECYLLMASVQPHLYRVNKMEHNYFMFNELHYDHERMKENLRKASAHSNEV